MDDDEKYAREIANSKTAHNLEDEEIAKRIQMEADEKLAREYFF